MGKAVLALAVAVLGISWGAPLARLTHAAPLAVAMWRMMFATAFLIPITLAKGGAAVPRGERKTALLAGLFLGLHFGLWIPSLWLTSVSASVVLVTTQPLWVLIASPRFLGVPIRARNVVSFALALAGVTLIAWGDFQVSPRALLGDAMALAGAACMAAYLIIGKRLRASWRLDRYLTVVHGGAAVTLTLGVAAFGVPALPDDRLSWLALVGMALGPSLTGHGLLNWALAHLEAYRVNLAVLLEPLLASIWTWIFVGEAPPLHVVPGAVLVLTALTLEFLPGHGHTETREQP